MPRLICPNDKTENPIQALFCQKCHERLSRVQVGAIFVDRYWIQSCLGKTSTGFRYLVNISATGELRILYEIIPDLPSAANNNLSFHHAAVHVIESRPRCLVPVLEHFSWHSCYYTVQAVPSQLSVQEAIENYGPFSEQRASMLLNAMLSGLQELFSLTPPVYLGALDSGKTLLVEKDKPVFLESHFLSDIATGPVPSPKDALKKDLYDCACVVMSALRGESFTVPQDAAYAVSNVNDVLLGYTLDWILQPNDNQPDSLAMLEQFRRLVAQAQAEMQDGANERALDFFNDAFQLSHSRKVAEILEKLEEPARLPVATVKQNPTRNSQTDHDNDANQLKNWEKEKEELTRLSRERERQLQNLKRDFDRHKLSTETDHRASKDQLDRRLKLIWWLAFSITCLLVLVVLVAARASKQARGLISARAEIEELNSSLQDLGAQVATKENEVKRLASENARLQIDLQQQQLHQFNASAQIQSAEIAKRQAEKAKAQADFRAQRAETAKLQEEAAQHHAEADKHLAENGRQRAEAEAETARRQLAWTQAISGRWAGDYCKNRRIELLLAPSGNDLVSGEVQYYDHNRLKNSYHATGTVNGDLIQLNFIKDSKKNDKSNFTGNFHFPGSSITGGRDSECQGIRLERQQ